jgi:hypothetical protein
VRGRSTVGSRPPNKRLKLSAHVEWGMTTFSPVRCSLSAIR